MRMFGPHVTIIYDQAKEGGELFEVGQRKHFESPVDFLLPQFEPSGSKSVAKKVTFLACPFSFERIDWKPMLL